MCFYTGDYDWYAQVNETTTQTKGKSHCVECHRVIVDGEERVCLYQRQYEECHCAKCFDSEEEESSDRCDVTEGDYGETYEADWCMDCRGFLDAVQAAELAAGCRPDESQPYVGRLWESIQEAGAREAKKYAKEFLRRHPDRRQWLAARWRWMFGE